MQFRLCSGGHLRALLQKYVDEGHAFSEAETFAIMFQLLSAVTVLHTNGVIHRDVKLDNILLASNDLKTSVRLADFGAAQYFTVHDVCPFQARIGTERYMAPEVLRGKYSYEADVFSCGVVMYYLLTGQVRWHYQLHAAYHGYCLG
jgi:calcium-dependent protein kinase